MNNKKYTKGNLNIIKVLFSSFLLYLSVITVSSAEHDYIMLGVHPYLPESEIIKKFTPLASYLSKQLNKEVRIRVSNDYESHIERVVEHGLDIAYMGPASYIALTRQYGDYPILARLEVMGEPTFKGVIVARSDNDIENLNQLKDKRVAFGDSKSTMSYLVPKSLIEQAGVTLNELDGYRFLGNHENVALSVLLGQYDAGAVKEEVFEKYKTKGLKAIAITPAVSEHMFVAKKDMDKETVAAIKNILLSMSSSEQGKEILRSIKSTVTALIPAEDKDYDSLREIIFRKPSNNE